MDWIEIFFALGGKDLVHKMLGPTKDYIGREVKTFVERRREALRQIFENAAKKLGPKLNSEDGTVPPRVLKTIIEEGSYADDNLAIEYFGGVLASSRSETPRDNRGIFFSSIVSRLTNYQLRAHYIHYALLRKLLEGQKDVRYAYTAQRRKLTVAISLQAFARSMEFGETERNTKVPILINTMVGLLKEDLIEKPLETDSLLFPETPPTLKDMIVGLTPTHVGMDLFLWAHGKGDEVKFFNADIELLFDSKIILPEGSYITG